ncbi:hypothetical protein, partial [Arthrobacter sp.]|uniref:hypothetical protein n=1 Tax=Arthrobacter sp. TaxID=1667 RepID=UPI002810E429
LGEGVTEGDITVPGMGVFVQLLLCLGHSAILPSKGRLRERWFPAAGRIMPPWSNDHSSLA